MLAQELVKVLGDIEKYFERSTSALDEADSEFAPAPGMFTAAQQVAEAANTLEWFVDGALGNAGWDMDFDKHQAVVRGVSSLAEARERLKRAFARAVEAVGSCSDERLDERLPADDPIMPGNRRADVLGAIADHTAHHRGALTVYARLLGKVPPMPYM